MAVHMTYKSASATKVRRKKGAEGGGLPISAIPVAFRCRMVQVVEAPDEQEALRIAAMDSHPINSIPIIYELRGPLTAENEDLDDPNKGVEPLDDNLYFIIYP